MILGTSPINLGGHASPPLPKGFSHVRLVVLTLVRIEKLTEYIAHCNVSNWDKNIFNCINVVCVMKTVLKFRVN